MHTADRNDDDALSISTLRRSDGQLRDQARSWVYGLNETRDREDGPDFWRWMESHEADRHPCSDTWFFLSDVGSIVGTASVVDDDRGIGHDYAIAGPWIVGVVIDHAHRRQGYFQRVMAHVELRVAATKPASDALTVNLISSNPIALKIYRRLGFQRSAAQERAV